MHDKRILLFDISLLSNPNIQSHRLFRLFKATRGAISLYTIHELFDNDILIKRTKYVHMRIRTIYMCICREKIDK